MQNFLLRKKEKEKKTDYARKTLESGVYVVEKTLEYMQLAQKTPEFARQTLWCVQSDCLQL